MLLLVRFSKQVNLQIWKFWLFCALGANKNSGELSSKLFA